MKLSQLAAKPQLTKLVLDDEDIVKEFGESVEFWTWDRQPIDIFMKLASVKQDDPASIIGVVRDLILDDKGYAVISKDNMLPNTLLVKAIAKIVETLGK